MVERSALGQVVETDAIGATRRSIRALPPSSRKVVKA